VRRFEDLKHKDDTEKLCRMMDTEETERGRHDGIELSRMIGL